MSFAQSLEQQAQLSPDAYESGTGFGNSLAIAKDTAAYLERRKAALQGSAFGADSCAPTAATTQTNTYASFPSAPTNLTHGRSTLGNTVASVPGSFQFQPVPGQARVTNPAGAFTGNVTSLGRLELSAHQNQGSAPVTSAAWGTESTTGLSSLVQTGAQRIGLTGSQIPASGSGRGSRKSSDSGRSYRADEDLVLQSASPDVPDFPECPQFHLNYHDVIQRQNEDVRQDQAMDLAQKLEGDSLKRFDSPRTREACNRLGVKIKDLETRSLQSFKQVGDTIERVRIRFNHYEAKRQDLLKKVLCERGKIVGEKSHYGDSSQQATLRFMEDLLDKEAKRLEKEIKSQTRFQTILEKENKMHTMKTENVHKKILYRKERNGAKLEQDLAKAKLVREDVEAKARKNEGNRIALQKEEETRQTNCLAELFEEEVRLLEFNREKELQNKEKSEQRTLEHGKRLELIHEIETFQQEERAEELHNRLKEKSLLLQKKAEQEAIERDTRSEEQHLKVLDAVDRKQMLARQDEFKRGQVAKQLQEQNVRIDTFQHLKEQIVEARKARIKQLHKGRSQSANRLNNITPGPAAYNVREELDTRGPVISKGKTKQVIPGSIDAAVESVKENPPPGCYDPRVLATGERTFAIVENSHATAPGFAIPQSQGRYLDELEKKAQVAPGPGAYDIATPVKPAGGSKMVRAYMPQKEIPEWIQQTATPGPGAYQLDPYMRQQRLLKYQKSLPTLPGHVAALKV